MHAYAKTHTHTSQRAERREHCRLCMVALLHFRTINVCLLYEGTRGEKRNSCWCLFELWPNPTWGGCVGARFAPNPSRSCTPRQTHTYCTHSGTQAHTQHKFYYSHTHTHIPVHPSHIKVCLSFPAHHFRSSQSRYFPLFPTDTHTFTHTHCSYGGGPSVG